MKLEEAHAGTCPNCCRSTDDAVPVNPAHNLVRCNSCGFVFASSRIVPSDLYEDAYSTGGEYQQYVDEVDKEGLSHLSWAMRNFLQAPGDGKSLLDVGCSTGSFLQGAQLNNWSVTGLEISSHAAQIAHQTTGANVYTVPLDELDPPDPFDAVTAWEVLEHIENPRKFASSAKALLVPGGMFAVSVPNWGSPWMRRSPREQHWPPYHLNFWTADTLRYLLEQAGFADVAVREKPFAWTEEVGRLKWALLPVSLIRSALFGQRGMHLYAVGRRP